MDASVLGFFSCDGLGAIHPLLESHIVVALIVCLATAAFITLCVPGILIPTAMASGALLGAWPATTAVVAGTLVGSQLLFLLARRVGKERLRAKLGRHLGRFEHRYEAHSLWYVAGLRLVGVPHFMVTAGSALTHMKSPTFAAATLLGMMPVVFLAAAAGAALR